MNDDLRRAERLQRNLSLVPIHQALTRAMVWAPVFVLFSRAEFGLDGAFLLGALYYLFVVALEVPSGWLSDRFGRVRTLRLAAGSFTLAQVFYLIGSSSFEGSQFLLIVVGQLFLAGGWASLSGTDVAFHYDTLEAIGREETYATRQSKVSAAGFVSAAVSAVAGGLLGLIDLRLTFVASLLLALVQLGVTFVLTEPPSTGSAARIIAQLRLCVAYLRDRLIGWIFFYGVVLVTLEHVAFTMMQPWLTEVLGQTADDVGATPLFAGLVFATVSFVGAGAARASAPLAQRFGVVATLIGFGALSAVIVTGMALSFHWLILGLVAFRSAQGAAAPVLMSTAVAPRTEQQHRATLLSINSLGGRLGYGLILLMMYRLSADDLVGPALRWFSVISWTMVAALVASAVVLREALSATAPRTSAAASPERH